jgi:hypothetical protein
MSTMKIKTTAVAAVFALGLLAGCGSEDTDDADQGAVAPTSEEPTEEPSDKPTEEPTDEPSTVPEPEPSESELEPESDPAACADLECEITLSEGAEIPADGEYGITLVTFTEVSPDDVQIQATGPGISLGCGGTPGSCTLNGVLIEVTDVQGDTAVVTFTP